MKAFDVWGERTVCTQTATGPSAALACNLSGVTGDLAYQFQGRYSDFVILDAGWLPKSVVDAWGGMGLFLSSILFFALVGASLWHPTAAVLAAIVSIVASWGLGLLVLLPGAVLSFIVIGLIVIWKSR